MKPCGVPIKPNAFSSMFRLAPRMMFTVRPRLALIGFCLLGSVVFAGCAQQLALQRANRIPAEYSPSALDGLWFVVARTNFETAEGNTRENLTFRKKPEPNRKWSLTYRGWSNQRGIWFEEIRELTESETGLLVGSFFGLPPSPLYIVAKDRGGRALLLATSSRLRFLIVSRDQSPDPSAMQALLEEARANLLPVEGLLFLQNP
jgi:hypothetical protein